MATPTGYSSPSLAGLVNVMAASGAGVGQPASQNPSLQQLVSALGGWQVQPGVPAVQTGLGARFTDPWGASAVSFGARGRSANPIARSPSSIGGHPLSQTPVNVGGGETTVGPRPGGVTTPTAPVTPTTPTVPTSGGPQPGPSETNVIVDPVTGQLTFTPGSGVQTPTTTVPSRQSGTAPGLVRGRTPLPTDTVTPTPAPPTSPVDPELVAFVMSQNPGMSQSAALAQIAQDFGLTR